MKVLSVVGARPEFIQAMPVSQALRGRHVEVLVHTGQHFDYLMSQAFFDELGLSEPDYNLEVGSGTHAVQTGAMLGPLEEVVVREHPEVVIVRGDTNSTLAGALVASKVGVPLVHIEAGERSFDRHAPEEINRLLVDRVADLHLCVSRTAIRNLEAEGITETARWVGDVMHEAILKVVPIAHERSDVLRRLGLEPKTFGLVTIHRANNTDDPKRLSGIVDAMNRLPEPVIFPVHPRTKSALERHGLQLGGLVRVLPPLGYLDMVMLESAARLVATDSGGVQREAYYLGVPCLTLREETEWVETVSAGWNRLVGVDPSEILAAWTSFVPPAERPPIHGDDCAGRRIVEILEEVIPEGRKKGR